MSTDPITKALFEGGPMDGKDKSMKFFDPRRSMEGESVEAHPPLGHTIQILCDPRNPTVHFYRLTRATEGLGVFTWFGSEQRHYAP